MFHDNLFSTAFNTDWSLELGNESNGYLLRSVPIVYPNSSCNCVISDACKRPLQIGPSDLVLPGLVVGCLPIDGLRMSTLECFFLPHCISIILMYLDYYTDMDGSPPLDFLLPTVTGFKIAALSNSTQSRFLPTTPIDQLISELLTEQWIKNISYETYYSECSPISCRYEHVQRNSILYVATSLLAIYGGLTIGLRLLVWNGVLLYRQVKRRHRALQSIVQPCIGEPPAGQIVAIASPKIFDN